MAVVLLTTAFQSVHALTTHSGHHHQRVDRDLHADSQLSFEQSDDDCSICDFHFDFFITPETICLRASFTTQEIPYAFSSIEGRPSFPGSMYAHRGPPASA